MSFPGRNAAVDDGRRKFLRLGLASAMSLSVVSATALLSGCSSSPRAKGLSLLREADLKVLAALVPVVMAGRIAADAVGVRQVDATIHSLDAFLATTSVPGQKQILQLFDLLSMPLTRYSVAGLAQDWDKSSAEEIEAFLDTWSKSRFELLRGGYLALSQLIGMSWYMQPESWVAIGYQPPLVTA